MVPRGLGARARQALRGEVIEVAAGDRLSIGGVTVEAVAASHWISPGAPRAQPVGYVVDAGPRIYFAGDTGPFAGLDAVLAGVDVALLPVWTWGPHRGPGHLGPKSAAQALAAAGPTVAIPIHWGTLYPRRLHRVWSGPLHEPGDRFAEHARRLAPATTVRVLRPGEDAVVRAARSRPQPAAFLTSSAIRCSTAGVRSITANSVAHMSPSSSLASGWKPTVE